MKLGMVACINIVYMENLSTAGTGDRQKFGFAGFMLFTPFRPFGIDLQNFFFLVKMAKMAIFEMNKEHSLYVCIYFKAIIL